VLECVINISEGRDEDRLARLARAAGASLRDVHRDPFHHRSVFTLINPATELERDVHGLLDAALELLDIAAHQGVHPRLGVVDVVPFVALAPESISAAIDLRDRTARWIALAHEMPVFLYGPLPEGERTLPHVRAHAFKDLSPDFGPAEPDARAGAAVVGAREILVAWNLWLTGVDIDEARLLAKLVRRPGVRALGLPVGDAVQVSCNLYDLDLATPSMVYDLVASQLEGGGAIQRAELVGLAPRSLLAREERSRWAALGLSEGATIESRLER